MLFSFDFFWVILTSTLETTSNGRGQNYTKKSRENFTSAH